MEGLEGGRGGVGTDHVFGLGGEEGHGAGAVALDGLFDETHGGVVGVGGCLMIGMSCDVGLLKGEF